MWYLWIYELSKINGVLHNEWFGYNFSYEQWCQYNSIHRKRDHVVFVDDPYTGEPTEEDKRKVEHWFGILHEKEEL